MKPHKDNKVLSVGSYVDLKQTSRAIIRLRLEFQFGFYTLVTMLAGYFIRSFFFLDICGENERKMVNGHWASEVTR